MAEDDNGKTTLCKRHEAVEANVLTLVSKVSTVDSKVDTLIAGVTMIKNCVYMVIGTCGAAAIIALGAMAYNGMRHDLKADKDYGGRDLVFENQPNPFK